MASTPTTSTNTGTNTPPSTADRSGRPASLFADDSDSRFVFRSLLARLPLATLRQMAAARAHESEAVRASTLAGELTDQLDDQLALASILKDLDDGQRSALGLFGLTEARRWPVLGLRRALAALGFDGEATLIQLIQRGLLAVELPLESPTDDPAAVAVAPGMDLDVWAHPSLTSPGRIQLPVDPPPAVDEPIVQVRESDGLEPILRLAALWQRTGAGPLRRTQQGILYKRDRERIEDDGVLTSPIDDVPVELPALSSLWMGLARRVGLLHSTSADESLNAASAEFWTENAVHLPQMIASAWLGLHDWTEWAEPTPEDVAPGRHLAHLRPALLLWIATLEPDAWTTIDDLASGLDAHAPGWSSADAEEDPTTPPRRSKNSTRKSNALSPEARSRKTLEQILLGGAFAMGLVRSGETQGERRRAVQLTPLGRYALAMGPPPPPRPTFDQFLFVQPNLEVIAYRQGLTPPIIGRLSRFAWWTRIGAAVELKLTQESTTLGMEWGLTASQILDDLSRHSQRALPTSVKDAVDRWADRREQVTFYPAATLIEFNTRAERDHALVAWAVDAHRRPFVGVGDRFLLVEDAQDVPTSRISTTASRDYRLPPERCVTVEADGVTLTLDPARSDLLVEAELARFAVEEPMASGGGNAMGSNRSSGRRRFTVSIASLERGLDAGLATGLLDDWFRRRTGDGPPPAVGLMLRRAVAPSTAKPWSARRRIVLASPSAELLDGILQHPDTAPLLGDRLGPTAVVVPEDSIDRLRAALKRFGVEFELF